MFLFPSKRRTTDFLSRIAACLWIFGLCLSAGAGIVRQEEFPASDLAQPVLGHPLTLPAFDGTSVTVLLERQQTSRSGIRTWGGRVSGSPYANVSVTETKTGYVVRMTHSTTGNLLSFSVSNGTLTVRERTLSRGGRCESVSKARTNETASATLQGVSREVISLKASGNPLVDGAAFLRRGETRTNVVDVLVGVDASAARWIRTNSDFAGEDNAVELFAADSIRRCNNTLANTDLDKSFTFNLAGVIEVQADCSRFRNYSGYVDSVRILDDMTERQGRYAAEWRKVANERDQTGADIVSFLVSCGTDELAGIVGVGYSLDNSWIKDTSYCEIPYNVCLVEAVAQGNTMAHEIGHNMGAGHAKMKDASNSGPQLYGYSTGYYFDVTNADGNVFMHAGTVMAYNSDGYDDDYGWTERWGDAPEYADDALSWNYGLYTETDFFSSSSHTFRYYDSSSESWVDSGVLLGDATHDNTRLLAQTYLLAANYRVQPPAFDQSGAVYELVGGVAMDAVQLTVNGDPSLAATFTMSGLPTGLKYAAATRTISGTPTKIGTFAVPVTVKYGITSVTYAMTFEVKGVPVSLNLVGEAATAGGTVTGGGESIVGQKRTLVAKSEKGYVFAGWYADASFAEPISCFTVDHRTASVPFVVPAEGLTAYARFVSTTDDAELEIQTEESYTAEKDGSFQMTVPVSSQSLPKLSVKGLPTGLKFNAKNNSISGTATKPGTCTVTVSATNLSVKKAISKTFQLTIPNFESSYLPNLNPAVDAYPMSAGVAFDAAALGLDLTTTEGYVLSAVKGLPAGLKFNAKTGEISGVATKAGTYTVTITAKNGKLTTTATVTFTVSALPAWAVGTFNGAVFGATNEVQGLATWTVAANGKISGKVQKDGLSWTLAAASYAQSETDAESSNAVFIAEIVAKSGKDVMTNRLSVAEDPTTLPAGVVRGRAEMAWGAADLLVTTYQNLCKTEPFKTAASSFDKKTVDVGGGVSFKLSKTGVATAAGRFVTGQDSKGKDVVYSATCSTIIIPMGENVYSVPLYFPPNSKKNFNGFAQEFILNGNGE